MAKPESAQKLYQDDPRPCFLFDSTFTLLWGNPAFFAMYPFAQLEQPVHTLLKQFKFDDLFASIMDSHFIQQDDGNGSSLQITLFYNRKKPFCLAILTQSAPSAVAKSEKNNVLMIDYYINTLVHPLMQRVSQVKQLIEEERSPEQVQTLFGEMERQCRMLTRLSYLTETYYRSSSEDIPPLPKSFRSYFAQLMMQTQKLFENSGCVFTYSDEYATCGLMLDARRFEVAFLGLLSVCYEYEKGRDSRLYCRAIYDKEQLHIFVEDDVTPVDEVLVPPERTVLSELSRTDDLVLLYRIVISTLRQVIEQHGGSCEIDSNHGGIQVHIALPAWPDQKMTLGSSDDPNLIPIMLSNIG